MDESLPSGFHPITKFFIGLLGLFLSALLVLGVAAWIKGKPPVEFSFTLDAGAQENKPLVSQLITRFVEACDIDFRDISTGSVDLMTGHPLYDYRTEQYGWETYLAVELKVKNSVRNAANGHTLTYYVGGGSQAGVHAQKEEAGVYCPRLRYHGPQYGFFLAEPTLKIASSLH